MIEIKKPERSDIAGIQEIIYQAWLLTYPDEQAGITVADIEERFRKRMDPENIQKRADSTLREAPDFLFLVAKDNEQVVGFCRLEKKTDYNELVSIYVSPSHHRLGIGTMLWQRALDFFGREKDIILRVADYNERAISFYQKHGFVPTGKHYVNEKRVMPISGRCIPEIEMILKAGRSISES